MNKCVANPKSHSTGAHPNPAPQTSCHFVNSVNFVNSVKKSAPLITDFPNKTITQGQARMP